MECIDAFQLRHAIHVGRFSYRIVNHGAFALFIFQIEAHRLQDRQQIRKDNRRVHSQSLDRRHHDFAA